VEIRRAAEHRLGDLGWKWKRDEEPYPRRLEPRGAKPCGVCFVRDKLRDEHHSEKTAEACERDHADTLVVPDAFPCVGDQCSHYGSYLSKQRAAWRYKNRVTETSYPLSERHETRQTLPN
jgi:hypothetical protein